uniref:Uncharacterized protein n=1 Tax=Setaria italica TaxID=4555 RepID=K3ZAR9_SETIT
MRNSDRRREHKRQPIPATPPLPHHPPSVLRPKTLAATYKYPTPTSSLLQLPLGFPSSSAAKLEKRGRGREELGARRDARGCCHRARSLPNLRPYDDIDAAMIPALPRLATASPRHSTASIREASPHK